MNSDPEANLPFLFAVFIITWALFFAYAIYMSIKQRRMEKEIDTLRASLSRPSEVLGPQQQNLNDE